MAEVTRAEIAPPSAKSGTRREVVVEVTGACTVALHCDVGFAAVPAEIQAGAAGEHRQKVAFHSMTGNRVCRVWVMAADLPTEPVVLIRVEP